VSDRPPLLELHRVCFTSGEQPVLTDVSLTVHEQEIVGVVFQQGIGKSALLRIGAGLLRPTSGEVVFRGKRLAEQLRGKPELGMVFEDGALMENTTVFDNVALPLRFHTGESEETIAQKVDEVLSVVGMEHAKSRFPWQLTRDRARLVALARAMIYEPALIFVDDFFQGADAEAFSRMSEAVSMTREAYETAFLLVMEATPDSFGIADRLCLVDHGMVLELDRPSMLG